MSLARYWLFRLLLLTAVSLSYTSLSADQVILQWDANSEPNLAGYKLYYGQLSGVYETDIDVGNVTQYTLDIQSGTYVAATAYNTEDLESGYSNEVFYETEIEICPATDGSITYEEISVMVLDATEEFDFTSDLDADANWDSITTAASAELVVDGDAVKPEVDSYETHNGIFQTGCDGVNQWALVQLKTLEGASGSFGCMLRQANADGSGACYGLKLNGGIPWVFRIDRYSGATYQEHCASDINDNTPTNGHWYGFSVSGTGNTGTTFNFWDFGASEPGDYGDWGDPTQTTTPDGGYTAVDTGAYIGLNFYTGNNDEHSITTWRGGDIAAAGGAASIQLLVANSLGGNMLGGNCNLM